MRKFAALLALLLPLAGLAALWGWSNYRSRQGNDWTVPIAGYDPRDLLRGHYIEFTYDWPVNEEISEGLLNEFCIEGAPPAIERITRIEGGSGIGAGDACTYYARADDDSYYRYDGLRRGRLYIPQTRATDLENKLRDRNLQGYIRVRQREDGKITPLEITFEPITEEQRAARENRETGAIEPVTPIDAERGE